LLRCPRGQALLVIGPTGAGEAKASSDKRRRIIKLSMHPCSANSCQDLVSRRRKANRLIIARAGVAYAKNSA
jgi:hypothetical protein